MVSAGEAALGRLRAYGRCHDGSLSGKERVEDAGERQGARAFRDAFPVAVRDTKDARSLQDALAEGRPRSVSFRERLVRRRRIALYTVYPPPCAKAGKGHLLHQGGAFG